MNNEEYQCLQAELKVLKNVAIYYPGRTIENIIGNIEARLNITETPTDTDFDTWWNIYDKKVGRAACVKKWQRLTRTEQQECIDATPAYVAATPNKQYRKNPITYLNQKAWNDEIITNATNPYEKLAAVLA